MLKYSKFNSVQGGPFNNINRMVDLEVPEGIQMNPSQSFVQLVLNLGGTGEVVTNYNIAHATSLIIPYNVDFIKNCFLTGDKVGRLEDIRRVNVLRHNVLELSKGTIEKMCLVDSIYQAKDYNNGFLISPFVEFHKDGNVASSYRDLYIRIPLSDLFSLGDLQMLDTSKTGKLRIHLELDKTEYMVVQRASLFKSSNGEDITDERGFEDLTVGTPVIVSTMSYENLQNSPYFVGQTLSFGYVPAIGGVDQDPEVLYTVINSIAFNSETGLLTLTLADSFPAMTGGVTSYNSIFASEIAPDEPVSLNIMTCELGVAEYPMKVQSPDVLNYTTFTTEEFSAGSNSVFLNKVFEIEPNAINAMLMFDPAGEVPLSGGDMISHNVHLDRYRMRIDNQDVYDRDILTNYDTGKDVRHHLTNDSLHYDSINRTFLNASIPLRNLTFMAMIRNFLEYDNLTRFSDDVEINDENKIMILATPTPLTTTTKKLQFNLENKAEHNIGGVILYKQCVKTIQF
jgi:hypothetical protein